MNTDLELADAGHAGWPRPIAADLAYLRTGIVNVFLAGPRGAPDRGWVLVDAGMFGYTGSIRRAAEEWFGAGSRPSTILMTHGHFDHVGALELAEEWDCPVYAHPLEMPYLTGRSAYPPPDPSVGGGAMARLSFLYPRGPFDVGGRARPLPADGSVPGMPGWRWIHTPGHTAGHVAFFRDADRTLIAGDAFVTTRQESLSSVVTQRPEVNGPPMYYTPDWGDAERSVRALAALEPEVAATGHGHPLRGAAMRRDLRTLAMEFRTRAMPDHGRYVDAPAVADERGVVSVPPARGPEPASVALTGLAALAVGGALLGFLAARRRSAARDVVFQPGATLDAMLEDGGDDLPPGRRTTYAPRSASASARPARMRRSGSGLL